MKHLRIYSFQCHHITWNGKSSRLSMVAINPGQVHTITALCSSMFITVRSQVMMLLTRVVTRILLCECHTSAELYVEF